MQDITENMLKKKGNQLIPDRRIFIYSGHDVTLVNFLRALEMHEQTEGRPKYAATVAIELHSNKNILDDLEVKILYYYDSEDKTPKELKIPGCESPCALNTFVTATQANTVQNYEKECQL